MAFFFSMESGSAPNLLRTEPVLHKQEYAKPGDSLNYRVPVVVEVATEADGRTAGDEEHGEALQRIKYCGFW